MDSNPGKDLFIIPASLVGESDLILGLNSAVNRLYRACELDKKTVPHSLDNCSLILFEDGLQETPVILEQLQRSPFV